MSFSSTSFPAGWKWSVDMVCGDMKDDFNTSIAPKHIQFLFVSSKFCVSFFALKQERKRERKGKKGVKDDGDSTR